MTEIYSANLPNEAATKRFAATLAQRVEPGDLLALTGDLGAGKTTFARAFIRAICASSDIEVPSPTFTLVQTYEAPNSTMVFHSDLYRLRGPEDIEDLGLEEERDASILLIEWPDRMPPEWWHDALKIELLQYSAGGGNGRVLKVQAENSAWKKRLNSLFGPK